MVKAELVEAIASEAKITKKEAETALDAVLSVISTTVLGGGKVQLKGFGTFEQADRAARMISNPQDRSGPKISVPAKKSPRARLTFGKKPKV